MQQLRLETQLREATGKGAARTIRRNGMVPGILYGLEKDNNLLQIDEKNLHAIIGTEGFESSLINLEIGSTGSEIAILAFFLGKFFFRTKLIFLETVTRPKTPSFTARIVYPMTDLFLVQWETLLEKFGPKAQYRGRIL